MNDVNILVPFHPVQQSQLNSSLIVLVIVLFIYSINVCTILFLHPAHLQIFSYY